MTTDRERRSEVARWVMRLIDYGKGAHDPELDDMTVGQITNRILDEEGGHP